MRIAAYDSRYKGSFIQFNTDWIVGNFGHLEKEDIETFETIEEALKNGAMIYFAVEDDTPLATCMAKPMDGETWEICKLASNPHREHKGCGSAVFEAAMQWAVNHGAKKLFLLSNHKLEPAIHIYKKYGFQEIKLNDYEYVRGDIAFERVIDGCNHANAAGDKGA